MQPSSEKVRFSLAATASKAIGQARASTAAGVKSKICGHGLHNKWRSHFGLDEHQIDHLNFDVHQGYGVWTHSHEFAGKQVVELGLVQICS